VNMNSWDTRLSPIIKCIIRSCLLLAILCSVLQMASSPAPANADSGSAISGTLPDRIVHVPYVAKGFDVAEIGLSAADAAASDNCGVVTVNAVGPTGGPAAVAIRLFRIIEEMNYEYAYSDNGSVEAKVPPGSYVAYAYDDGAVLVKTDVFEVARYDHKYVVLEVSTAGIQGFAIHPEYRSSGKLSRVLITHSVVNIEGELANAEVRLSVTFNGAPLESTAIVSFHPLMPGTEEWPFYYTPAEAWEEGQYGFSLQLYSDGVLYAETAEQTLRVADGGGLMSWLWIVLVIAGVLAVAAVGFLAFFLLKKRRKIEKPAMAETKQHEEKSALRAAEPAPKPEAAPPAEPARHLVEPVQGEETVGQPASSLSSVSSLKARMAAMGREQGTVQDTDKGPDAENTGSPASALKARMASLDRNQGQVKDTDQGPDTDSKGPGLAGK
jgi:Tfp pilus assembly protein PilE